MNVPAPLYISPRLMAAVDLGEGRTVEVGSGVNGYYHYIIEENGEIIDEGTDLRCPMAADYGEVMASLLSFLGHYAEHYRYSHMDGSECSDACEGSPISPALMEFCYMADGEISVLAYELGEGRQVAP